MEDFKVITYKKNRRSIYKNKGNNISDTVAKNRIEAVTSSSYSKVTERIKSSKEELKQSIFYQTFIQNILQHSKDKKYKEIICYGIGQFLECVTSRYQFAFLLLLKDQLDAKVFVYDPVFSSEEISVARSFDCNVIDINEEGKRVANCETLFFLPHCPKQLINNLLWKNWNNNLKNCTLVTNSLSRIVESHPDRFLKENLFFVYHATLFVKELEIDNSFRFTDIFNDLSIHFFFDENIVGLRDNILLVHQEPIYKEGDIEFVTKLLQSGLSLST